MQEGAGGLRTRGIRRVQSRCSGAWQDRTGSRGCSGDLVVEGSSLFLRFLAQRVINRAMSGERW
jgi:hypothetical protein